MGHFEHNGSILFDGKDWEELETDDVYDFFECQMTREEYDEYLNSGYNPIEIAGSNYDYAQVYKAVDEDSYDEDYDNWVWDECKYYIKDELLKQLYENEDSDYIYGYEIEYVVDEYDDENEEDDNIEEWEISLDDILKNEPTTIEAQPITPEFTSEFSVLISN